MVRLILVRHGETNWNKQKRVQGALDIPLNREGGEEARRISSELSKFKIDVVYSSPVSCSCSTAHEIATTRSLKVIKIDELNEVNHGIWQGLLLKDIKKRYKKQYNTWKAYPTSVRPPKGESIRVAYDRAVSAMHKIVDKHKDESICIVSGGIILSIIKCYLRNIDPEGVWKFIPGEPWEVFEL
ncbi:MAG: histidine phosphatase family protein [Candidatus Omnitrophota bacterium]|nr:MAG: histidine phosphatase family protein [Candidatus Omnitrophota bacterium]